MSDWDDPYRPNAADYGRDSDQFDRDSLVQWEWAKSWDGDLFAGRGLDYERSLHTGGYHELSGDKGGFELTPAPTDSFQAKWDVDDGWQAASGWGADDS